MLFCVSGNEFPTSEHYYMYRKALFHHDPITANEILEERNPKSAKRLTSEYKDFDQKGWDKISVEVSLVFIGYLYLFA